MLDHLTTASIFRHFVFPWQAHEMCTAKLQSVTTGRHCVSVRQFRKLEQLDNKKNNLTLGVLPCLSFVRLNFTRYVPFETKQLLRVWVNTLCIQTCLLKTHSLCAGVHLQWGCMQTRERRHHWRRPMGALHGWFGAVIPPQLCRSSLQSALLWPRMHWPNTAEQRGFTHCAKYADTR